MRTERIHKVAPEHPPIRIMGVFGEEYVAKEATLLQFPIDSKFDLSLLDALFDEMLAKIDSGYLSLTELAEQAEAKGLGFGLYIYREKVGVKIDQYQDNTYVKGYLYFTAIPVCW